MTALIDAALAYAGKGWPIFPAAFDKTPLTKNGVMDATTDPKQITAWWTTYPSANIALDVGGAGMIALDLDPGHDPVALDAAVGGLPETLLKAKTPRGGTHLFYALAAGEVVAPSASKLAPHVDVRSFHSYVLLAPSKTVDGAYTWQSEGKPAYRTDELMRKSNTARSKSKDNDTWIIDPDRPENVAAAIDWLKTKAKVSTEGQGGDNQAYATAAHLKSYGVSEPLAFDLMLEHWNPRCSPPWAGEQLDHLRQKVINGYSYNTSPPGNITIAYREAKAILLFQPARVALPSGVEITCGRFRFVDRDGLDHIKPADWLIPDFLPQGGYAIMFGAPGSFKSFLAIDIALSVATGATFPWVGLWPEITATGPVLYSLGEGRPEVKKRVQAWEKTHWRGHKASGLILADPVPLIREAIQPFIAGARAASPAGYRFIVLDTIGRSLQGENENAQENASQFTALVDTLRREFDATILALHHVGHGEASRERGSSVFRADADTVIGLERQEKEYSVAISMPKQKDAAEWESPRVAKLIEVKLGAGVSSLAAIATPTVAPVVTRAREAIERAKDATVAHVLDQAILATLGTNKLHPWSTRALCEALAMRPDVDISSETLRGRGGVIKLREDKTTAAHRCYNTLTQRWRWHE